jgi:hypothetical protein
VAHHVGGNRRGNQTAYKECYDVIKTNSSNTNPKEKSEASGNGDDELASTYRSNDTVRGEPSVSK